MFRRLDGRRRSVPATLKLWGGLLLALGILLLLVRLLVLLAWYAAGAVALAGLIILLAGIVWEDLRRGREP
jgi:hypothetical protein